jgi:hypothetical protein
MILSNSFSLNMLESGFQGNIAVKEVSLEEARALLSEGYESAVGHVDTAAIFSNLLGVPVPANRATIRLQPGARLLVGQYRGPRLEDGATSLPPGASIGWYLVEVQ